MSPKFPKNQLIWSVITLAACGQSTTFSAKQGEVLTAANVAVSGAPAAPAEGDAEASRVIEPSNPAQLPEKEAVAETSAEPEEDSSGDQLPQEMSWTMDEMPSTDSQVLETASNSKPESDENPSNMQQGDTPSTDESKDTAVNEVMPTEDVVITKPEITTNETTPVQTVTMDQTVAAIKNACAELPQQTQANVLRFLAVDNSPDPLGQLIAGKDSLKGSTCNWFRWDGQNRHSGYRSYSPVEIPTLPEGATLCSSTLRSESGKDVNWKYDDEFYLTINNRVMTGSHKDLVSPFEQTDGFYLFDFEKILGKSYSDPSSEDDLYCFGHSGVGPGCRFPPTQVSGPVDLSFDAESFAAVSAFIKQEKMLDVRLIVTGDNDPSIDCEHSGISFEWTWSYVMESSPPAQ